MMAIIQVLALNKKQGSGEFRIVIFYMSHNYNRSLHLLKGTYLCTQNKLPIQKFIRYLILIPGRGFAQVLFQHGAPNTADENPDAHWYLK